METKNPPIQYAESRHTKIEGKKQSTNKRMGVGKGGNCKGIEAQNYWDGESEHQYCSGVFTTSVFVSLRNLHPRATTSLQAGHKVWLASSHWIMSRTNSGGKSTQWLYRTNNTWRWRWRTLGGYIQSPRSCICFLSTCLLDLFLEPYFISLNWKNMPLNGIIMKQKIVLPVMFSTENVVKHNFFWINILPIVMTSTFRETWTHVHFIEFAK